MRAAVRGLTREAGEEARSRDGFRTALPDELMWLVALNADSGVAWDSEAAFASRKSAADRWHPVRPAARILINKEPKMKALGDIFFSTMSIPTMSLPTPAEVIRASTILTAAVRFLWSTRGPLELFAALQFEQTPAAIAAFDAARGALLCAAGSLPADASLADDAPPAAGEILARFAALPLWERSVSYPFVPAAARAIMQPAITGTEHHIELREKVERLNVAIGAYDSALRALDSQDALHPRDRAGASADARRVASRARLAADRAELERERVEANAVMVNWSAREFIERGAPGWAEWGAPALELVRVVRREFGRGFASGLSLPSIIL